MSVSHSSQFARDMEAEGFAIMEQLKQLSREQFDKLSATSATGNGGPALRCIKTPVKTLVPARQHVTNLSRLPANPKPCGIPRPMVVTVKPTPTAIPRQVAQAKRVTRAVEGKRTLDKATKETAKPKKATVLKAQGKSKAVTPAARPALLVKSAMKSSGRGEKTVKKVGFGDFNQAATVNVYGVRSRPQPSVPMKTT